MTAKGRRGCIAALTLSALLLAVSPAAAERNVSGWFGEKEAGPYGGVQPAVEEAARAAVEARVPEGLLVERLREGAAKGVEPARLQRALEEDAAVMAALAVLLDHRLPALGDAQRTEALRLGAIAVRGGLEPEAVDTAIGWSVDQRKDLQRTMSALVAVAALRRGLGLEAPEQLSLAKALVLSGETSARFGSFVSLLSSARARGVPAQTVLAVTLDALGSGRSFLAVQRELERKASR